MESVCVVLCPLITCVDFCNHHLAVLWEQVGWGHRLPVGFSCFSSQTEGSLGFSLSASIPASLPKAVPAPSSRCSFPKVPWMSLSLMSLFHFSLSLRLPNLIHLLPFWWGFKKERRQVFGQCNIFSWKAHDGFLNILILNNDNNKNSKTSPFLDNCLLPMATVFPLLLRKLLFPLFLPLSSVRSHLAWICCSNHNISY